MNTIQDDIRYVDFKSMSDKQIFVFIMTKSSISPLVAKYLSQTLELRKFLRDQYKVYI